MFTVQAFSLLHLTVGLQMIWSLTSSSGYSLFLKYIHLRPSFNVSSSFARFRRDAAKLLEILSNYQKRQIVEFLPYHDCDMMNHHSPDVACLMELQARYTQYRHTVLISGRWPSHGTINTALSKWLTAWEFNFNYFNSEHHFEKFPIYSSRGIIMAGIEEFRRDFTRLVGYHDIKDNQANIDEILAPKGQCHYCGRRISSKVVFHVW